ncbi:MAG: dTDP-4-dehydrorhamnose reductase [Candidatus Omnitrophota bacterium]
MKVLISGVTGMLGTSLAHCFLTRSHEVCGISRGETLREPFPGERRQQADITQPERLREVMTSFQPDVVIHSAAISDVDFCEREPETTYRINAEGTRIMAQAAEARGAVLVYISTDYVFDGERNTPYREEDPCRPVNHYGKSKWEGEKHVRALCERHLIVRTSWLFGENQDSFVHHVLTRAKTKNTLRFVADKWSTPTYTPDLAALIYSLLEKKLPFGVYHMTGGGEGCSWFEYGKTILRERGVNNVSVLPMLLEDLKRPARRPRYSVLSPEKFSDAAGMSLRPWQEALRAYVSQLHFNLEERI